MTVQDNIVFATDSMRTSVSSLKKKLSNLKISIEQFDSELEKIDTKFDKLLTQTEIYKSKLEREMGREVRRLQQELNKLRKQVPGEVITSSASSQELSIASTIAIFESLLRYICDGAEDFRLISYAFLFPAVIERVNKGDEEAYFLEEIPASAELIIQRGREYVAWTRNQCDTHLTDPESWERFCEEIANWWRNDALPLIYGSRDEQWDIEVPLSLAEMLMWRDDPAERPIHFSPIFDAYEIYRNNKDAIYERSGLRDFELRMFSFANHDQSPE